MGWSFRVGRLAGIDIFVHFTFLILLGFIGLGGYLRTGDPVVGLVGVGMIAAVFGIIVLHEMGHALAARYYGIPTKDITLLPIGGVARLQRMPEKPAQELVVALAGPAVNVVLAVFFGAVLFLRGAFAPPDPGEALTFRMGVLEQLFLVNVGLVLFNMLPAFPMDGGRVLRALLAMRLGARRATDVAAVIGKGMAVLFALVGLFGLPGTGSDGNLMLVLVALFVWTGADAEARAVRAKAGLAGVPVAAVMVRRFAAVDPDDTLAAVADYAHQSFQRDFPVVVGGRVVGLLGREDLRAALIEHGPTGRVFQAMRREFPTVGPDEPAERGLSLLAEGAPIVPVVAYGQLAGMLTPEHLAEFVWVRGQRRDELPEGYEVRTRA
jgi:Zn-dependent protease/CBS domain-containing protein